MNLNGTASWVYFYPESTPELLCSFKVEPAVRLADIAPELSPKVRPRDLFAAEA